MRPDCGNRKFKRFYKLHCELTTVYYSFWLHRGTLMIYSQRSASMGSSRAAFHAGHRPNTMPTAAEMPTPTAIAQIGTYAGNGEYLLIRKASNSPMASPA